MKRSNHTLSGSTRLRRVGIFDHASLRLGGSQLVVANMAAHLSQLYEVDMIHSGQGYTLAGLATAFGLDLTRVTERIMNNSLGTFSPPGLKIGYLRR